MRLVLGTRSLIAAASVGLLIGNLGRIPYLEIGGRAGALTLIDLTLIPLWLYLGITLASRRRRWRLDAVSRAGLLFVVVALASLAFAVPKWNLGVGEVLGAGAFLARWVLYAGWYLLIVTDPEPDAAGRAAWTRLDRAIIALAAFGIFQSAFLPGFAQMIDVGGGVGWDQQGRRLVSTLLDPNLAGGLIVMALLMRVARVADGLESHRGVLFLFGVALLLTLSRSAVIGLAAGLMVIVAVRGVTRPLLRVGAVAGVLMLPVLPVLVWYATQFNKLSVDASAIHRLIPWLRGGIMLRDNPVLGVGFNATGPAREAYGWAAAGGSDVSMDGGLFFVAVMTGLVGLAVYVWMLGAFGAAARRTWGSAAVDPERRAFALGAGAATLAVVIQSFFVNVLLIPWMLIPLWVIWGRVAATAPAPPRALHVPKERTTSRLAKAAPLVAMFALLGVTACEPCAGLARCSTAPQRIAAGVILDRETQEPVAGITVRAAGRETATNSAGRWRLVISPLADTLVDFVVQRDTGASSSYTVRQVNVRTTTLYGDAHELGVWYDRPFVGYVIGIFLNGTPLNNATLRFTASTADGGFVMHADFVGGNYSRFTGPALSAGPITGVLRVTHSSIGTRDIHGVVLEADHALQIETIRQHLELERAYSYVGHVLHRGNGISTPGATVRFTRTGGIGMSPNPVTVTAGAGGYFNLTLRPFGKGTVIGTLRVTPPGGAAPHDYPNVAFSTYDSTHVRWIGQWPHGHRWHWVVEIRRAADSSLVTYTPWRFVRDSGMSIGASDTLQWATSEVGRLLLNANISDTGTVRGQLTIFPPSEPPRSAGTLRLRSFAADSARFAGVRYIASP